MVSSAAMMSRNQSLQLLLALLALFIGVLLWMEPIPQPQAYHRFADTRGLFGIPNFLDIGTNAAFLLVGAYALIQLLRRRQRIFRKTEDARPYLAFFLSIFVVSFGSGWYHIEPTNDSLLWDRIPIATAFMSLTAAMVADRIDARAGNGWLLAVLLIVGIASLIYWNWSESLGRGDLRFYGLVKFYPILALPLIVWLFPKHHYFSGGYLAWIFAWHTLALVFEKFDHEIFELTGELASGHSLKHLAAGAACWLVYRMLCVAGERETCPDEKK